MHALIEKLGEHLRAEGLWRTWVRALGHIVYLHNRWIDRGFEEGWDPLSKNRVG